MEAARKKQKLCKFSRLPLLLQVAAQRSNNMILMGFRTVFASSVEHEAVLAACPGAYIIDVDQNGVICLDHLERIVGFSR